MIFQAEKAVNIETWVILFKLVGNRGVINKTNKNYLKSYILQLCPLVGKNVSLTPLGVSHINFKVKGQNDTR